MPKRFGGMLKDETNAENKMRASDDALILRIMLNSPPVDHGNQHDECGNSNHNGSDYPESNQSTVVAFISR